jgi:hypothetical protein
MSDETTKTGLDRKLISLAKASEVRSWCKSLGCDEAQLRKGVEEVGDSAEKVRVWMKNNK